MNTQSVILRKIRTDKKLTIRQAAKIINKSSGWISDVENNKQSLKLLPQEFKRIATCYGAENELRRYQLWANTQKSKQNDRAWFEGAILKHLRLRKELSQKQAAGLIGISTGYLSNIEASRKQPDLELRNKILTAYNYKSSSYHNYAHRESRAASIPAELKLKILVAKLGKSQLEEVFKYAQKIHVTASTTNLVPDT